MNESLLSRVEEVIMSHGNHSLYGLPAEGYEIDNAEKLLNVRFNEQYIMFIKRFGGAFGGVAIHAFKNGSLIGKETVVELTQSFRRSYVHSENEYLLSFYAISDDGAGNPLLMNEDGIIIIFYHDTREIDILYDSLESLLMKSFP